MGVRLLFPDGDGNSFSQVFVFDVVAAQEMKIERGWLKGILLRKDERLPRRKVELIYHWQGGRWRLVDDGPID